LNRKPFSALLAIFITASGLLLACNKPRSSVVAITHVTVIDMTGASPASDQTVLIEKEKIIALGPSISIAIPPAAQILDARGKFLIPALSDMHLHLTGAGEPGGSREFFLPLLLANGIASVRDMGGYLDSLIPLRKEIEEGKRLGPHIIFAGPYLDGDPPAFQPAIAISSRREADDAVQSLKQREVDFIKVQSNLSRDSYFAVADAAKKQNMSFVGHVPDRVTAWEAAAAGQKSIEHLTGALRACSTKEPDLMHKQFRDSSKAGRLAWQRELLSTYSDQKAAELTTKFRERQTWQTPTLILLRNVAFPSANLNLTSDPRVKYVPRKLLETWGQSYAQQMNDVSAKQASMRAALLAKSLGFVGQMQKGGVKILAGTDSAAPYVFPGFSLHEELALLVQAGLTPMEAMQTATRDPAEFLDNLDLQGTVTAGKNADLLLLDANPLDDIRNTQKIRALVLRGKLLDRVALDQLLVDAQEFAAAN
jgi:imidazolonepropionase-like amidohydrolase